jgi:hypothetical protein
MFSNVTPTSNIDPAFRAKPVTKSDENYLRSADEPCRRLYIGGTGDVTVLLVGDEDPVTYKAVPVGYLYVMALKVMSTNTDATDIVAEW